MVVVEVRPASVAVNVEKIVPASNVVVQGIVTVEVRAGPVDVTVEVASWSPMNVEQNEEAPSTIKTPSHCAT